MACLVVTPCSQQFVTKFPAKISNFLFRADKISYFTVNCGESTEPESIPRWFPSSCANVSTSKLLNSFKLNILFDNLNSCYEQYLILIHIVPVKWHNTEISLKSVFLISDNFLPLYYLSFCNYFPLFIPCFLSLNLFFYLHFESDLNLNEHSRAYVFLDESPHSARFALTKSHK
jgi:hypothetical protein